MRSHRYLGFVTLSVLALGCGGDNEETTRGPGAALECTSSGKNAFDTYGTSAFVAVNKAIFAEVTAEITANGTTNLGTSFSTIGDAARFEGRLAAFLVFAYGGPTSIMYTDGVMYEGSMQNMAEAHAGMNITAAQYDYFVANVIVPALTKSGVTSDDVSSCFAPVVVDAAFKATIVGQ
jgi:hypothetical protein